MLCLCASDNTADNYMYCNSSNLFSFFKIIYSVAVIVFRENDIDGVIDTTFAVEHDHFGQLIQHELMSGGNEMQVTNDNKDKYVR